MLPTLQAGDFILVNKFAYGLRLPVLNLKILPLGEPNRGDVVVFKYPKQPKLDYIKRVVGLPGDKIAYRDKRLYINGELVEYELKGPYERWTSRGQPGIFNVYQEELSNAAHEILLSHVGPIRNIETTIPQGYYFVMGDNRDDSHDSRFWGALPEENLVGKAFFIWMNFNLENGGIEFDRIGKSIQ